MAPEMLFVGSLERLDSRGHLLHPSLVVRSGVMVVGEIGKHLRLDRSNGMVSKPLDSGVELVNPGFLVPIGVCVG